MSEGSDQCCHRPEPPTSFSTEDGGGVLSGGDEGLVQALRVASTGAGEGASATTSAADRLCGPGDEACGRTLVEQIGRDGRDEYGLAGVLVSEDHHRGPGGEVVEDLGGQLPQFVRRGIGDLLDDELPAPDEAGRAGESLGTSPQLGSA